MKSAIVGIHTLAALRGDAQTSPGGLIGRIASHDPVNRENPSPPSPDRVFPSRNRKNETSPPTETGDVSRFTSAGSWRPAIERGQYAGSFGRRARDRVLALVEFVRGGLELWCDRARWRALGVQDGARLVVRDVDQRFAVAARLRDGAIVLSKELPEFALWVWIARRRR